MSSVSLAASKSSTVKKDKVSTSALIEQSEVQFSKSKAIDNATTLPVITISAQDISASGHNSVSDLLRDMSASLGGAQRERSGYVEASGVAYANLRGLGPSNTLVLVDGVRFIPFGAGDAVNLNLIPVDIIESIVIYLTDMSSLYGSDAVAGAINIKTKSSFDGVTANVAYTLPTEFKGGNKLSFSLMGGSSSAKTKMLGALSVRSNSMTLDSQRPWSDEKISLTGSPGSYIDLNSEGKPDYKNKKFKPDPSCSESDRLTTERGVYCKFNYANYSTALPDLEQQSAFMSLEHKVLSQLKFKSQIFFSRTTSDYIYAPTPNTSVTVEHDVATASIPDYDGDHGALIYYRTLELGTRDTTTTNITTGLSLGLELDFLDTWKWSLNSNYSQSINESLTSGNGLKSGYTELVKSGEFKPFAAAGSRGDLSTVAYETWQTTTSDFFINQMNLNGEVFNFLGRPVGVKTGATHWSRDVETEKDKISVRGDTLTGAGGPSEPLSRSLFSTYLELNYSPYSGAEFFVSTRRDDYYKDFGVSINPRAGFKFPLFDNALLIRASAGTGFKAPPVSLLDPTKSTTYERFVDNYGCKVDKDNNVENTTTCEPAQYEVEVSGNPDLGPVNSFSWSAGFIFEPIQKLSLTADYWVVAQKDTLTPTYSGFLYELTQYEAKNGQGSFPASTGVSIPRDENGYINPSELITLRNENVGQIYSSGLQALLKYDLPIGFGKWTLYNSLGMKIISRSTVFKGGKEENWMERHTAPKWRNSLGISWDYAGVTSVNVSLNSTDKYKDSLEEGFIDRFHQLNASFQYSGFEDFSFHIGVKNLLMSDYPLDKKSPQNSLDDSFHDPRGPTVYAGLRLFL